MRVGGCWFCCCASCILACVLHRRRAVAAHGWAFSTDPATEEPLEPLPTGATEGPLRSPASPPLPPRVACPGLAGRLRQRARTCCNYREATRRVTMDYATLITDAMQIICPMAIVFGL